MGTNPRVEEEPPVSNENLSNYSCQPPPVSLVPGSNIAETESSQQIASACPFQSETSDEAKSGIKVANNTEDHSFSFNR